MATARNPFPTDRWRADTRPDMTASVDHRCHPTGDHARPAPAGATDPPHRPRRRDHLGRDRPAGLRRRSGRARRSSRNRTFQVAGHSYAILVVDGLARRLQHAVRGPLRWRARLADRGVAVSAEPDPDDRPGPASAPDLRLVPITDGGQGQRSDRFRRGRPGRLRPPDRRPGAGRLAGRPADARRPGLRGRDVARRRGRSSRAGATRASRRTTRSPTSRSTPACTPRRGATRTRAGSCRSSRAR